MLDARQPSKPESGKGRLLPLDGGMEKLDHYYHSLSWVAATLLLPVSLAHTFIYANALCMGFMVFCFLAVLLPTGTRGLIIILDPATGNAAKASLWWRLAFQGYCPLIVCCVLILLAYGLLDGFRQGPLPSSYASSLLGYVLFAALVAALLTSPFLPNRSTKAFLSMKRNRRLFGVYVGSLLLVSAVGGMSTLLGAALSLPFAWALVRYLRYRAERDAGKRIRLLDSTYAMFNFSFLAAIMAIMGAAIAAIHPSPGLLASNTSSFEPARMMPFFLLVLIGLAKSILHREQIRKGMFEITGSERSGIKPLDAWNMNSLLELSQQKPILRTPRQLAWMRLVCWLGDRRWQAGSLSSLAMIALALAGTS